MGSCVIPVAKFRFGLLGLFIFSVFSVCSVCSVCSVSSVSLSNIFSAQSSIVADHFSWSIARDHFSSVIVVRLILKFSVVPSSGQAILVVFRGSLRKQENRKID